MRKFNPDPLIKFFESTHPAEFRQELTEIMLYMNRIQNQVLFGLTESQGPPESYRNIGMGIHSLQDFFEALNESAEVNN